jgi:hypothetical protein
VRICEFEHARLRNGARQPFGTVGDFFASIRREPVFGPVLTHWDEAAAYAVMAHLAPALSQI